MKSALLSKSVREISSPQEGSVLAGLIQLFEEATPLRLSFEDLTGVLSDVRDLSLPWVNCIHSCEFCRHAKSKRANHQDCIRNKMAVNRLVRHRRSGLTGQCHLGMTDLAEPLIYQDQVLGIFYGGSVVVEGTEEKARQRILKYCHRRQLNPAPFLSRFKQVPRIKAAELSHYRSRLKLIVKVCERIIEAHGLPVNRYPAGTDATWAAQRHLPVPVRMAIRHVSVHYGQAITLKDVAERANCHPDTLCRVFRQAVGYGLGEYVKRVRIDHARRLISCGRLSLGEIAFQVGFQDQSHFGRAFKQFIGCTPGEYAKAGEAAATPHPIDAERPSLSGEGF